MINSKARLTKKQFKECFQKYRLHGTLLFALKVVIWIGLRLKNCFFMIRYQNLSFH